MSKPTDKALQTWPEIAHRRDVYDSGAGDELPKKEYGYHNYRRLGVLPVAKYETTRQATAAAKAQFGPRARCFKTARFWVCYTS